MKIWHLSYHIGTAFLFWIWSILTETSFPSANECNRGAVHVYDTLTDANLGASYAAEDAPVTKALDIDKGNDIFWWLSQRVSSCLFTEFPSICRWFTEFNSSVRIAEQYVFWNPCEFFPILNPSKAFGRAMVAWGKLDPGTLPNGKFFLSQNWHTLTQQSCKCISLPLVGFTQWDYHRRCWRWCRICQHGNFTCTSPS